MRIGQLSATLAMAALLATSCALGQVHTEPLALATIDDGNAAVYLANPGAGLPNPTQEVYPLSPGTRPHGVAFLGQQVLYQDFVGPRIFRINPQAPGTVPIITLAGRTRGNGSLAVDPSQRYALSIGESLGAPSVGEAVVVDFGLTPPRVDPVAGGLRVLSFVSSAIDFAPDGRAFVCHTDGISVLSPPYRTIDFTMAFPPVVQSPSVCRLSRDGSRLFVTRVLSETSPSVNGIRTTEAPYSADSVFTVLPAPSDVQGLAAIAVAPDGQAILVGQQFLFPPEFAGTRAQLFLLRAPFDADTLYERIELPPAVSGLNCSDGGQLIQCPGFEHIELSRDGSLAVVTGNSGVQTGDTGDRVPAIFISHPFDDDNRSIAVVQIGLPGAEGRGAGGVAFASEVLLRDSFE
ncbi:MAG: hypothetical protein KDI48_09710 [Xanthomonadales bacterium]|nr:hypothetical protein [Xanthomonadales bacterium]